MSWALQLQSTLIVTIFLVGWVWARQGRRRRHVATMSLGIAWDLLLVLQIELGRGAVAKAAQFSHNALLLNIHVVLALGTILLYGIMVYNGRKLLRGAGHLRPWHQKLGLSTLGLRLLVYVTSFWVAPQMV